MLELPAELWVIISMDNPTTYYKLLQVSKVFKLDEEIMKSKFIRKFEGIRCVCYQLPNRWYHSCNDQPAKIWPDGTQRWYINDKLHRDNDRPAVILARGAQYWYINGKLHRDNDKPAIILANGTQHWYINGKECRDNDLSVSLLQILFGKPPPDAFNI